MNIAIPTAQGKLCLHFGHCEEFVIITVEDGRISASQTLKPPLHEPGVLPRWLAEQNTNLVIASGMGQRAQMLFNKQGIDVIVGAPSEEPEKIVKAYLDGNLAAGQNICDH